MTEQTFQGLAKNAVVRYYNENLSDHTVKNNITTNDVYIVWMVRVLQNNKALLSTTVNDDRYYEFTVNGDKREGYLDVYQKEKNEVISIPIEHFFD